MLGGAAAISATCVTHPLDVLKVRMLLHASIKTSDLSEFVRLYPRFLHKRREMSPSIFQPFKEGGLSLRECPLRPLAQSVLSDA